MASGFGPQDDPHAYRRRTSAFPLVPFAFRYEGRTQAVVAGPISGLYYRFPAPGTRVVADERDVPWLELLPNLRRV